MLNKSVADNSNQRQAAKANGQAANPIITWNAIPDIWQCHIKEPEWLVERMIARGTVNELYGLSGAGKSYLGYGLAIAVALGKPFLGRECLKTPVLYLDRENPGHTIQKRLKKMAGGPVPNLKVWGQWASPAPYLLGSPGLASIVQDVQPFLLLDHFRNFHKAKENSSDEMTEVMGYMREYSHQGATVLFLHHPPKAGNGGRGSGEILGDVDAVFKQKRTGKLVILDCEKNRPGEEEYTLTIAAVNGQFTLLKTVQKGWNNSSENELEKLREIIAANPGTIQEEICDSSAKTRSTRWSCWSWDATLCGVDTRLPGARLCTMSLWNRVPGAIVPSFQNNWEQ